MAGQTEPSAPEIVRGGCVIFTDTRNDSFAQKFFLDTFSYRKKYQIPISALTARKHSTAKSKSSLVCPAETWVRMRARPWGTTG